MDLYSPIYKELLLLLITIHCVNNDLATERAANLETQPCWAFAARGQKHAAKYTSGAPGAAAHLPAPITAAIHRSTSC